MGFALFTANVLAVVIWWGRSKLTRSLAEVVYRERVENTALRSDAESFEQLFEMSPGLVCVHDLEGRIVSVNEAGSEQIGLDRELLTGMQFTDFLWDPSWLDARDYLTRVRRDGSAVGIVEVRNSEGVKRVWKYSAGLVDIESNPRVVVAGEDITDMAVARRWLEREVERQGTEVEETASELREELNRRMEADARVQSTVGKMRGILDALPDVVLVVSRSGVVLECRGPEGGALGSLDEDIVGSRLADVMPTEFTGKCLEGVRSALDTGTTYQAECEILVGNSVRTLEGRFSATSSDEAVVLIRDLTKTRELQEELRQAQRIDTVGRLAGGVAHDFNNILTAIIGYTDLARAHGRWDPLLADYLHQIMGAGARAKDLVQQLLMFSRQTRAEQRPIRLQDTISEVMGLLRPALPSSIDIVLDVDPESGAVDADTTQLHQVLMNLCTNASDAMGPSGGTLRVGLREEVAAGGFTAATPEIRGTPCACITVEDTGCGMDEDTIARIFDPFFTTKNPGKGTGLGLSVVHGIVLEHGGAIRVGSGSDEGTRFEIYLPLSTSEGPVKMSDEAPDIPTGTERVLVLDDEAAISNWLAESLETLGYRATSFTDSTDALGTFVAGPEEFDLVITDQTMPHLGGEEFVRRLLEARPGIPVILHSGYPPQAGDLLRDVRAYLQKPVRLATLAQTVRDALN